MNLLPKFVRDLMDARYIIKSYRDTIGEPFDANSVIRPLQEMAMMRLGQKKLPPKKDHKSLMERYAGWAYICASRNAASIAAVPLKLYAARATGEQKAGRGFKRIGKPVEKATFRYLQKTHPRHKALQLAEEVEEIVEHPVLDLLQNVNPKDNRFDAIELTSTFLDVVGNAYWYVPVNALGIPQEFWTLQPQLTFVVPDETRIIKGYLYGLDPKTQKAFDPSEIVHFRMPNPHSQFYGLGCIEATLFAVDRYHAMDEYEQSLNENMGVPSLWVNYKTGQLDEKKRQELEQAWNNRFKGTKRAGKVAVTDTEYDIKTLGIAPREMGFSEGRRWTRLEIADAFGVPLALLDTENVNLANAQTALYQYMKFTIMPRLKRIEEKLNERLIPYYNEPRLMLAFDNPVPSDQEYQLREDQAYLASGVVTINEVRQRLGKDPVEWGDEPNRPVATPSPDGDMGEGDEDESPEKEPKKAIVAAIGKAAGEGTVAPLTKNQAKLAKNLRAVFVMQEASVEKWLSEHRTLFGVKSKAALPERIFGDEWDGVVVKMTHEQVGHEFKAGTLKGVRSLSKRGKAIQKAKAKPRLDVNVPDLWVNRPEMANYVRQHTMKFAKAINQKTHDDLRDILADGIDAGIPIDDIHDQIGDLFKTYEEYRAERISRTETARAFVGGERQAYRDSGVVEKLRWLASGDACEFCLSINGKIVGVAGDFFKKGDTITLPSGNTMNLDYSDVEGPPLHCNCRCDLIPEIIGPDEDVSE